MINGIRSTYSPCAHNNDNPSRRNVTDEGSLWGFDSSDNTCVDNSLNSLGLSDDRKGTASLASEEAPICLSENVSNKYSSLYSEWTGLVSGGSERLLAGIKVDVLKQKKQLAIYYMLQDVIGVKAAGIQDAAKGKNVAKKYIEWCGYEDVRQVYQQLVGKEDNQYREFRAFVGSPQESMDANKIEFLDLLVGVHYGNMAEKELFGKSAV